MKVLDENLVKMICDMLHTESNLSDIEYGSDIDLLDFWQDDENGSDIDLLDF